MPLDEEAVLLYRKARRGWLEGRPNDALFNYRELRAAHACELFYEAELPEHLKLVHPVGTVLGRATYGDYLVAYAGASVGSDIDRNYPILGKGVVLFGGAKVLGRAFIGDNVWITANTVVQNVIVPSNSVVFPAPKENLRLREVESELEEMQAWVPNNYTSIGCAWRPTERNVIEHYWPSRDAAP